MKKTKSQTTTLYINGRFLSQTITGVQRYGRELLRELDILLGNNESNLKVVVLIPRNVSDLPSYRHLSIRRIGILAGHAWEQLELPLYSFRNLLFTPGGGAPLLHPRNVITIHDTAVCSAPAAFSFAFRKWYTFLYRRLCATSVRVLTVSSFSKSELIRWYGANPDNVTVTYLGCDHAKVVKADDGILQKHGLQKYGYILAVSTKHPNKNFDGIIKALPYLTNPGCDVVFAGKTLNHVYKQITLAYPSLKDIGYVTDPELRSLYENAACFVFPSFYEGFGLPAIEALSLGCPLVVSNIAAMREVLGDMALFCDPHDPRDIADKIREALDAPRDAATRKAMSASADRYNWSNCAEKTWEILCAAARNELI